MQPKTKRDLAEAAVFLVAFALILAALALALGCAPMTTFAVREYEADITFHGDTRHDRLMRIAWEESMREWRKFTRGRARLSVTWDLNEATLLDYAESPRIVIVPKSAPVLDMASARAHNGRVCAVVVLEPVPVIYFSPDACHVVVPVMLHELGHVLGLDDIERPGAVMHWQMGAWFSFTGADRHECHRVGLCTE